MGNGQRLRRRSANPWWRRLHHAWQALTGHERHKSNRVSFVDLGTVRYKQVRFPDASEARRVEGLLRRTREAGLFPGFVFRLENTLWVRYLSGVPVDGSSPRDQAGVVRFYARLYEFGAMETALESTDLHPRLLDNLRVLREAGVLDERRAAALAGLADRLRPEWVWTGPEYVDSLPKNFLVVDDRVVGIDVEAIQDHQLLGIGLAKAMLRWLDRPRRDVLDQLAACGKVDLRRQFDYANLSFLARYGVQNLMRGKRQRIRVAAFDRLCAELEGAGREPDDR